MTESFIDFKISKAAHDVLNERQRQKFVEGYTEQSDDGYDDGELSNAAACYAVGEQVYIGQADDKGVFQSILKVWPWLCSMKIKDRRSNLVRAGALIIAEIEKMDRKEERAR